MWRVLVVVGVACFALGLVGCKKSATGGTGAAPAGADEMKAKQMEGAKAMKAGGKTGAVTKGP